MQRKNNFIDEILGDTQNRGTLISLNDSGAISLIDGHTKDGYAIVSPMRGYDTNRIKEMINHIKDSGFSFTPVYGGYIENEGGENEEIVYEHSFIVYPYTKDCKKIDFELLRQFALNTCEKFNQDSVLIKTPDKNPVYLNRNGENDGDEFSGNLKFNDMVQEYFTDLLKNDKNNSSFTFTEAYINPAPQCYTERYRRYRAGEVFLSK